MSLPAGHINSRTTGIALRVLAVFVAARMNWPGQDIPEDDKSCLPA